MSMSREILRSKIHRAWVTETNLDYVGSIAIDEALMELVGIWPHEKVPDRNVTNVRRNETYVLPRTIAKSVRSQLCLSLISQN